VIEFHKLKANGSWNDLCVCVRSVSVRTFWGRRQCGVCAMSFSKVLRLVYGCCKYYLIFRNVG